MARNLSFSVSSGEEGATEFGEKVENWLKASPLGEDGSECDVLATQWRATKVLFGLFCSRDHKGVQK